MSKEVYRKLGGVLLTFILFVTASIAHAQGSPTVSLQPPSQIISPSATSLTVTLSVQNISNLGGFEFVMTYNPAVVHVTSATMGSFLSSTGRTVFPVGPTIDNVGGTLHIGAASFGTQAGPSGNGLLVTITLVPQGSGSTALGFSKMVLTDILGNPISAAAYGSSVTVQPPLTGDVNQDCAVNSADMNLLSAHWHSTMGGQNFVPNYDLNTDDAINLADVMIIASQWGLRSC
ncbi:MAG: hypothetical protein GXP41_00080 [Chloroflexi bacterium]|nr:hypothetical protein [Chloroflexota bacterium]